MGIWPTSQSSGEQLPGFFRLVPMFLELGWRDARSGTDPFRIVKKSYARWRKYGVKGMIYRLCKEHSLLTGRSVPLLNDETYSLWIEECEPALFSATTGTGIPVSIVIPVDHENITNLSKTLASIQTQIFPCKKIIIVFNCSLKNEVKHYFRKKSLNDFSITFIEFNDFTDNKIDEKIFDEISETDVIFVISGGVLSKYAINEFVLANKNLHSELVYCDEDRLDNKFARKDHWFKTDFSFDLLLSHDYISNCFFVKNNIISKAKNINFSSNFNILFSIIEKIDYSKIYHIRKILLHSPKDLKIKKTKCLEFQKNKIDCIASFINKNGIKAAVSAGQIPGTLRIRWKHNDAPLVSLIIPTRDRIDLLRPCVESILTLTAYKNFTIVIANNQSVETSTREYFDILRQNPKISIVDYDGPFNYSAICNHAVAVAEGELICLLNNDVEVIEPEWLGEMVSLVLREGMGCIGAKLLYPDNTVQHGGVILGVGGVAGHAHRYLRGSVPGYHGRLNLVQDLSAVTAACLLVKKSIYQQVGGMEEANLPVSLNDVDFCLKVRAAGYRNIYTPFAELYHYESKSRGKDDTEEKRERHEKERMFMQEKWGEALQNDSFYSPHLTRDYEQFQVLSHREILSLQSWS